MLQNSQGLLNQRMNRDGLPFTRTRAREIKQLPYGLVYALDLSGHAVNQFQALSLIDVFSLQEFQVPQDDADGVTNLVGNSRCQAAD